MELFDNGAFSIHSLNIPWTVAVIDKGIFLH